MSQFKLPGRASKFSLPPPFSSLQVLSGLDDAHPCWEGNLFDSLLIQIPGPSGNTNPQTQPEINRHRSFEVGI